MAGQNRFSVSKQSSLVPARTTLAYAIAGVIWIVVSDRVAQLMAPTPAVFSTLQTYKGWAFITVTSILLYVVLRGQMWAIERETRKRESAQEHVNRLNRVYAVLSGINQAIMRRNQEQGFFDEACAIAIENGGFTSAWISLFDEKTEQVKIVAHAGTTGTERERLRAADATAVENADTLTVIQSLRPLVRSSHLEQSMTHESCGAGSSAVLPLVLAGKGRGTLTLRSKEPGFFVADELRLLEELALDISFGMELSEQELRRKQAVDQLKRSESRYHSLVEHSPDAVLVVSDHRVLLVNKACLKLFGAERDEQLVGINPSELVHPDYRAAVETRMSDVAESFQPGPPIEEKICRLDGGVVDVEVVAAPIPLGELNAIHIILRDITERKRAEKSLRDAQERLRRVVSAGNIGLWDWDLRTDDVFYSPEWKRQIGYTNDEIGSGVAEWQSRIHPDDIEKTLNAIRGVISHPRRAYAAEYRFQHKNGQYRWILAQASVLTDEHDRPVRMLGSHVDVTDRKQLEDQFLQSQKMESVGRLAGGVAHDFNNLLSVIIGYAEMALEHLPEESPLFGDLQEIRHAGARAAGLTRQLLAFSRKQVLQPEVLDLCSVLAEERNMLERLLGEDIILALNCGDDIGRVKADRNQIQQVIMNLAVNARDAMPRGGKLTIELQNADMIEMDDQEAGTIIPGSYVVISVTDNGSGMDIETIKNIFEPFFTTKEVGKGTGLGLATVYGIVRQSGGQILVYSEVGQGTSFKVFLPRVDEEIPARDAATLAITMRGTETVLIVEDEPTLRTMTKRILSEAGYTVLDAANGADALQMMNRHHADVHLLLSDVVMPGMSGLELADSLVAMQPALRVLYMSGYADDAIVRHGMLDERMHFIGKPFTAPQLTRKVREVLGPTQATEPSDAQP